MSHPLHWRPLWPFRWHPGRPRKGAYAKCGVGAGAKDRCEVRYGVLLLKIPLLFRTMIRREITSVGFAEARAWLLLCFAVLVTTSLSMSPLLGIFFVAYVTLYFY